MIVNSFAFLTFNHGCIVGGGESLWNETPSERGSFYFPDFFLEEEKPFLTFPSVKTQMIDEFEREWFLREEFTPPKTSWSSNKSLFFKMMSEFRASSLKKAVPYTFLTSKECIDRHLFFSLLKHLIVSTQGLPLTLYGFWKEGKGVLGATPELLFRKRGKKVETMALAGTSFAKKPFAEKDFKEHAFVVEGLRHSLDSLGSLSIGKTAILPLKTLQHLKTHLEVLLTNEVPFPILTKTLHPTAALGTYPKEEALLKGYDALLSRERFGAPVGFVKGQDADIFVGIRNVQFDEEGMRIGAGCGIIQESLEEEEWLEACAKLEATKGFLGL